VNITSLAWDSMEFGRGFPLTTPQKTKMDYSQNNQKTKKGLILKEYEYDEVALKC
jgi:hypothetical protein